MCYNFDKITTDKIREDTIIFSQDSSELIKELVSIGIETTIVEELLNRSSCTSNSTRDLLGLAFFGAYGLHTIVGMYGRAETREHKQSIVNQVVERLSECPVIETESMSQFSYKPSSYFYKKEDSSIVRFLFEDEDDVFIKTENKLVVGKVMKITERFIHVTSDSRKWLFRVSDRRLRGSRKGSSDTILLMDEPKLRHLHEMQNRKSDNNYFDDFDVVVNHKPRFDGYFYCGVSTNVGLEVYAVEKWSNTPVIKWLYKNSHIFGDEGQTIGDALKESDRIQLSSEIPHWIYTDDELRKKNDDKPFSYNYEEMGRLRYTHGKQRGKYKRNPEAGYRKAGM